MPRNPLSDPLFLPALGRVLLLIAVGFVGVLLAKRPRSFQVLRRTSFFQRARTWLWIGPLFLVALFTGGFVAFLLAAYVAVQGLSEFTRMAGIHRRYAMLLMLWSLVGLLVAALARPFLLFLPFGFFILLVLVPVIWGGVEEANRQVGDTLFGYVYIGLPLAYAVYAKSEPWGTSFLMLVGVGVAMSDVAAYAVGRGLKGPKVIPAVNPTKTWSGTLGNLAGAVLGVALLTVGMPAGALPPEWGAAGVVVLTAMIALGAVWGDLTETLIRRAFRGEGGTLLLGFGFVLERVDSLLMAVPLAYFGLLLTLRLAG